MKKKIILVMTPLMLLTSTLVGCKSSTSEFTVKFDTDGGTQIADVKVKKGEKVTRPETDPSKEGYTFDDWYTTKEGNDRFDFDSTINADTTIYAHYDAIPKKFTVKFDTDGGSAIDDVVVNEGDKVTRPANNPTKDKYLFDDWYTTKTGDTKFDFNNTMITGDTTIYAKWKLIVLEKIEASLIGTKEFHVDDEINKSDIKVVATYTDLSTKEITDWTCDDFNDNKYKFIEGDKPEKEFSISYGGKTSSLKVTVGDKIEVSSLKLDIDNFILLVGDTDVVDIVGTIEPTGVVNKKINWSVDKGGLVQLQSTQTTSGEVVKVSLCQNASAGEAVITASCDDDPSITATCKAVVMSVTELNKFQKYYKKYNDAFQNSHKVYKPVQVKKDGVVSEDIKYIPKRVDNTRSCSIDKTEIAGGGLEIEKLVDYVSTAAIVIHGSLQCVVGDNTVGIVIKDNVSGVYEEYHFNSKGYLIKQYANRKSCEITYEGEPQEMSEEERFFAVYRLASDSFQDSLIDYELEDIASLKVNGEDKTPTAINYDVNIGTNKKHCTLEFDGCKEGGEVLAGSLFTYYNEKNAGIKFFIEGLRYQGYDISFYSDLNTLESGFKVYNEDGTLINEYRFDYNGYLNLFYSYVGKVEVTFNCDPVLNKSKFLTKFKEYKKTFNESTTKYTLDQIDYVKIWGVTATSITSIDYVERTTILHGTYPSSSGSSDFTISVDINFILESRVECLSENGVYKIDDKGTIFYNSAEENSGAIQTLEINKFGYVTLFCCYDYSSNNDWFEIAFKEGEEPK